MDVSNIIINNTKGFYYSCCVSRDTQLLHPWAAGKAQPSVTALETHVNHSQTKYNFNYSTYKWYNIPIQFMLQLYCEFSSHQAAS